MKRVWHAQKLIVCSVWGHFPDVQHLFDQVVLSVELSSF